MAGLLGSLFWGTSQLDDAVDRATSELLPSGAEDIALNLEICDQIRSKSVPPKDAMRALKRRLNHKNPNVQLLALSLTDTCIKNGGDHLLVEIASREFMDNLVSILKVPALNHDVKTKILRLVQNWSIAFEGKSNLSYAGEVYKSLQKEGFNFPPRDPAVTVSAMVDTQTAPEWIDSDVCLRCRTAFTFTNRKHHCRNCGLVFDQQCSAKTMALPHFGITQEVRVCDSCHLKLTKKSIKVHRPSQSVSHSRHRAAREAADADLQRAIQLSLEEVGAAGGHRPGYVPSPSPWTSHEPPLVDRDTSRNKMADEEDDPDLKAAIEASLREASAPRPSAPFTIDTPRLEETPYSYGYAQSYPPASATPKPTVPTVPSHDLEPLEADAILTFNQTVEQLQAQGGRDLSRYPAVNELFDKANGLRPKLAMSLSDTTRKEEVLTNMHEKLSQAVKLYDNLLTEQLSRPSWRAAPPVASTSASQPPSSYHTQYMQHQQPASVAPPVTHSQWSPQYRVASPTDQRATQPSYLPQAPVSIQQTQSPLPNGAYPSASTSQAYYSANMYQSRSPQLTAASPPPQQYSTPKVTSSGPVSVPHYSPSYLPHATEPPTMVAQPPPPPALHQQQQQQRPVAAPPSPTLMRHNTISASTHPHAVAPPPPSHVQTPYNSILAPTSAAGVAPPPINTAVKPLQRANTVAVTQPQHTIHQLHQLQQTAAPPQVPVLPSVPVAPPQLYMGATTTNGFPPPPPEERKEALLIDL